MGSELIQLLEQEARVEKEKVLGDARKRGEEILAGARKDALTRMSGRRHREEGSRNKSNKSKEEK